MLVQVKISPKILIPNKIWVIYSSNPYPTIPQRLEANHHHPTQLLALHQVTLSQMCTHWQQMLYTDTIRYHPISIPVILVKSWIPCLDLKWNLYVYIIVTNTHINHLMCIYKKTYETPCTNHDNHVSYVQKYSQKSLHVCVCVYTPIQISSFLNSPCEFQLPRKFNRFEKRHSNMAVHCSPAFEPKEARKKK